MRVLSVYPAIPRLDRLRDHSSVPANARKPGGRGGGPNDRREAALRCTGVSTIADLARSGVPVWVVVSLLLALTASDTTALAQNGSDALPAICRTNHTLSAFIEEASQRFTIPARWICSVLSVETAGNMHAKSPKGAMGLMQIMPATWAELRQRYDLGNDPYDPRDNILAGTAYLRELFDRYGSRGVFAAYNAGPTRYEEHLAGAPLPDETRAYVAKLANLLSIQPPPSCAESRRSSVAATLFVERADPMEARGRPTAFVLSRYATIAISPGDVTQMAPRRTGVFVARPDSRALR
ncbi:lytic transglycosylase domain-containing protein [Bradyrhizobium sp. Cham227]|nr:lytic transglycosylase domain-containing protein [Bradyrhizobium brasilense]